MLTTRHFSPATFAFLEALAANNNRDWFADHKQDFSDIVCDYFTAGTPFMRFLCAALRLPF